LSSNEASNLVSAYRLTGLSLREQAFSGEGAKRNGARWNSIGTAMVYTASTLALATLEVLVHLEQPDDDLPEDWRGYPAPPSTKAIGDEWIGSQSSLALVVPSAVIPLEFNCLINPNHPDASQLILGERIAYPFDARLTQTQK
jgi:RES domain-containing protein